MKKIYCTLFLSLNILFSQFVISQPAFYQSDLRPLVGESLEINIFDANNFSPGSSGANQTWNFPNLSTSSSSTLNVVDPATTPYAANFPNANVALKIADNYDYYNYTPISIERSGLYTSSGGLMDYVDPQKYMQFPMTYNTTFIDTFEVTFTTTFAFVRKGTMEVMADGYGTLVTPEGTFTNVLRIKFEEIYTDTYSMGTINYHTITYGWYRKDAHYPILNYSDITTSFSNTKTGYYLSLSNIGIDGSEKENYSLDIYPNPANNSTNLVFNLSEQGEMRITVINMLGQEVLTFSHEVTTGKNVKNIDISALSSGMYLIRTEMDGKAMTKKLKVN